MKKILFIFTFILCVSAAYASQEYKFDNFSQNVTKENLPYFTKDIGGLLGSAPIMPVNTCSPAEFVMRGGRIPAPIHRFKKSYEKRKVWEKFSSLDAGGNALRYNKSFIRYTDVIR